MPKTNYKIMLAQLLSLVEGEDDVISNLSNASALIFNTMKDLNWAGFYLMKNGHLQLGPFQGKPACLRIEVGKGVCGTAVAEKKTQLVMDVHQFPGHIACDSDSNSEIVVPLFKDNEVIGVLDIDSPLLSRFDEADKEGLEAFAKEIEKLL